MTTRQKAPAKQVDAPEGQADAEARINLNGCLVPIMFVMMTCMMGFLVWDRAQAPKVAPVAPVVTPVADLAAYTAPVAAKLATDQAKAGRVEAAYMGLRDAMASASGRRVTDSRIFEQVSRAFLTDLDAAGGVSVGTEIDNAVGAYLGMTRSTDPKEPGWEPMQFDDIKRARLVEILGAIATAAGSKK